MTAQHRVQLHVSSCRLSEVSCVARKFYGQAQWVNPLRAADASMREKDTFAASLSFSCMVVEPQSGCTALSRISSFVLDGDAKYQILETLRLRVDQRPSQQ